MATHFSTLTWKIPWAEEPDGLQSMGSQESATTQQTKQQQLADLTCGGRGWKRGLSLL